MYVRQSADGRRQRGLNIPANYSGSAFSSISEQPEQSEPPANDSSEIADTQNTDAEVKTAALPLPAQGKETEAGLFRLFGSGTGGIGFEELLILGLVFLISQNDVKDDLAFLLLLLLFVK